MGRKIIGVLANILVIMMLLVASFGCKSTTTATTSTTSTTSTSTSVATTSKTITTTTSATGQTLGDILGRSAGVAAMQYDMVITAPGAQQITEKIYVKKNKMRIEMTEGGMATIILMDLDAKTMYSYIPDQNMAIKMTFNPTTKSAADEAQSISSYNPTIVGTETIDGKICTIVQYSVSEQSVKMWLWQDRGLPIRVEATTAQGTTVMEYKNIQFSDIADSMFELPAGVLITTLGT